MTANVPAAAAAAAQQNAQQGEGPSLANRLLKGAAIYFGMQLLMSPSGPIGGFVGKKLGQKQAQTPSAAQPEQPVAATSGQVQPVGLNAVPLWAPQTPMSVYVYLSTSPSGPTDFERPELPHVRWDDIVYGDEKFSKTYETTFATPEAVKHNASLWADIYLTREGASPDKRSPRYSIANVHHSRKLLTRYLPQRKVRAVKSLLGGEAANETLPVVEDEGPTPIVSHWHRNLTLTLVSDATAKIPLNTLQPPVLQHIHLDPSGSLDATGQNRFYYPIIAAKDFWLMREHMYPLNDTVNELALRIELEPTTFFWFQAFSTLNEAFNAQASSGGGAELDEIKHMLTETSPLLLITTVLVTVLHMLFEFLAFSSDVGHWRNKKEMTGVSVRTILSNIFVQLIILLYLVDNSVQTSYVVLFSQGSGLLIEAWKITKAVDISIQPNPTGIIPYRIDVKDKHVLNEDEKKTQEYDKLAFRWVSMVMVPFLIGYTIYSLLYNEHRGWYSFVIETLTGFVQAFGFVQLIPQVIINWKLKSVAHMPMKSMAYKFFSTIVDDFFAFIIRMPWLHRLACFRDDVVFVVLLYQRYIYRVDYSRANEFGQVDAAKVDTQAGTQGQTGAKKAVVAGQEADPAASAESRKDR